VFALNSNAMLESTLALVIGCVNECKTVGLQLSIEMLQDRVETNYRGDVARFISCSSSQSV